MIDTKKFGEKIRFYRHRLGITQNELASRMHVSFQAISSWECGNTLPDIDNLCRLSTVFGIAVDTLLQKQKSSGERVLLGIDGGGTSTEFALFTSSGRVLKCFKLSGSNASTVGMSEALSIFYRGIDICLSGTDSLDGIFMGCAGGHLPEVQKALSERYSDIPIQIDSDGVNALLSADGDAAMICGTGMVFLRHEPDGGYKKIGGWGYRFGDYGSAYNYGREAVSCAMAYEDGVNASAYIYSALKEKTGHAKIRGGFGSSTGIAYIADQASVIFDAYDKGDPFANEIIHSEMRSLARVAMGVCPEGGRIIACGGINERYGHITLPILAEYIPDNIEFVIPKLPPVYGACREACKRFGVDVGEDFFENFLNDYKSMT